MFGVLGGIGEMVWREEMGAVFRRVNLYSYYIRNDIDDNVENK